MRGATADETMPATRRQMRTMFAIIVLVGTVAHLFRSSAGVVAPDILAELSLSTAWVAYITSGFFVAAAFAQMPAGMLFDTLGLQRSVPVLLVIASAGAFLFAMAETAFALLAGRLLMGIGCGAVIMGGVVLCARFVPPERFPSTVGLILALGQIGNIGATAPVAALASLIGWRGAFLVLGVLALAVALVYMLTIRDRPGGRPVRAASSPGLAETLRGTARILRDPGLRPVFAMAFVSYAASFSIAGVWGGVYLHDVFGLGLVARGNILFLVVTAFAFGLFSFGWLAQRLGSDKQAGMIGAFFATVLFALAAILPRPDLATIVTLFVLLGIAGGGCGTIITHGRRFYSADAVGRGVTVMNTVVLLGALTFQISTGLLMDLLAGFGIGKADAFRLLFAVHALSLGTGLLIYRVAAESGEAEREGHAASK